MNVIIIRTSLIAGFFSPVVYLLTLIHRVVVELNGHSYVEFDNCSNNRRNKMKRVKSVLFSCLLVSTQFVYADALPSQPHVAVTGNATIKVEPDTVKISFQSIAVEKNASDAKQVVDEQVQDVLSQLQKMGFEQELLIRDNIRLRPEYEYIDKKRTPVGTNATRNLSYQLDDLTKVNDLLQILADVNVSTIGQINYSLKDPQQWQLKVRELAVKDSLSKADDLAKSYQTSLGEVYSIKYQSNNAQPVLMHSMESQSRQRAPSYQHNQIELNDRVEAVFLLAP